MLRGINSKIGLSITPQLAKLVGTALAKVIKLKLV